MSKRGINKRYVLMLRWGVPTLVMTVGAAVAVVLFVQRGDPMARNADGSVDGLTSILARETSDEMVTIALRDVTHDAGIVFQHFPDTRRSVLPEDMGPGVAWGDYDDDGDQDLFLVNFAASILSPLLEEPGEGSSRLYRNDGDAGFRDVTEDVGLGRPIRGNGAAWGDYDGDGDLDLAVTAWGSNRLYRNDNGTFVDVAGPAGVDDEGFGTGLAWFDADGDDWIDLYICNYVNFEYRDEDLVKREKQYGSEVPFTLNPSSYKAQANRLYHNNGDGTFTDVAVASGVDNKSGRSLGAAPFDFDLDGDVDLYVANDVSENGVFLNRGDGTFEDIGASSLAADYRGAMGMAIGDMDRDNDLDLFVTHWIAQENAAFENMHSANWKDADGNRRMFFMDSADTLGLGQVSLKSVGWSTGFSDFDNDGLDDLWVVNGHTLEDEDDAARLRPQLLQLFRQVPGEGFYDLGAAAGESLARPLVGRGGASADYDGDGLVDLVVMELGGPLRLLRNVSACVGGQIVVRLRQDRPNTRALGAMVRVLTGESTQMRQVGGQAAYLSQDMLDLHFGIADSAAANIEVTWPDGEVSVFKDLPAGACVQIHRPQHGQPQAIWE
ncbi:MAG: CRTAC1 family protein [Phycisphaerae bacterium]|jgi:enediyne biosynthesis protein E4|nr:CRTAC1 family protein [Phycisphaerae bacterium]MBT5583218.1 CRTAC1 family protein [Phycisphaerae bacterium]MBT5656788.1 CRTAC1 family protein [Phycisphaerae bacterium]MBT7351375.1 CRTAC1 family protein [Phycisphaerae bacterium]